ncbi:adenine phosphoribosyltransferase [Candidatus Woesearchaeota archaeon]|nr:adenine phosphoribosyltransferase [Candidatus Woesearchaeota archaeon]
MKLVLASKSTRRKQILEDNGYEVEVDISDVDERSVKIDDVKELVMHLAELKAKKVAKRNPDSVVLAADTMVYFEGKEIGQQETDKDAEDVMRKLMGQTHEVWSGICVMNTKTGKVLKAHEVSLVTLKQISDEALHEYIISGQYKGKAGAYNITDPEFENFMEGVEGSYTNIMGLPIEKVEPMLKEIGLKEGIDMPELVRSKIRTVPHWPKQGIMFRDITTLLKDREGYKHLMDLLVERYKDKDIDVVAGIESRGFITGAALAHRLGLGFVPIRKKGKLPHETVSEEYDLEYGKDAIEIHKDAVEPGMKVLLIDDLIATGGTAVAAANLIKKCGGEIVEASFIVDLPDLGGMKKLQQEGIRVHRLVEFEGD